MDMRMNDCEFYSSILETHCTALKELVCQKDYCSFYKPRLKSDNNRDKGGKKEWKTRSWQK